jgi:glycosyltransferase involved in cell wall biosynthesis
MINEYQLEDYVHMMGAMRPEEVRKYMEKSEIFLFTSDQNEGWGAVLNESMNSACSVVVNSQIGSAPYLICDGQNGLHYHKGNADELFENVKTLMLQPTYRRKLGECAYHTMINTWNAQIAAQRLTQFAENRAVFFADGPMSPASQT